MGRLLNILLCLGLFNVLFAQRDEVLKDTLVNGKHFNVIMYDDSNRVACVGHYLPNTFIRTGEWDYFFSNGKIYAQTFFKLDYKTGIWVYLNKLGCITRVIHVHKKNHIHLNETTKDDPDGWWANGSKPTYHHYQNNYWRNINTATNYSSLQKAMSQKNSYSTPYKVAFQNNYDYSYREIPHRKWAKYQQTYICK